MFDTLKLHQQKNVSFLLQLFAITNLIMILAKNANFNDCKALPFNASLCGQKFDTILMPLIGSSDQMRFVSITCQFS